MDEGTAKRRPNLELVKEPEPRTSSGVLPATNVGTSTTASTGTMPMIGIAPGVVLDGKYLVGNIVGSGAVGIVFEAKNLELDEKVAIKCLRPEMLVDTAMVGRFAREAKAAAAIKSEYVATVHDVGTSVDGVPYIVMEFLEGKDLGSIVQETGTFGPRTAVEHILQVCEALAVAHAKGIVHRDIKPENLLLNERSGGFRIVKVLDFGISKAALTGSIFRDELPLVKTVNLMGTPLYMSPEQVRNSDSVDVRSDIWSLGMVLYEILTGQTAFEGTSITEICAAILETPPRPIELHRADLPAGLVEVIAKCLEKQPERRYQTIADVAIALMPFGPKRSRLNVERSVAVLQGAGQLDPQVRVKSTMPPPTSESFSVQPLPRPTPVSGISLAALPSASSLAGVATSESSLLVGPSSDRMTPAPLSPPYASEPQRAKRWPLVVGGLAVIAAAVVVIVVLSSRVQPAPVTVTAATKAIDPPVTAQTVTTPVVTPPATPAAATEPPTTAATVAAPTPPPRMTGRTWHWNGPPAAFAPPASAKAGATAPAAPPKAPAGTGTAKSDEPDLGY